MKILVILLLIMSCSTEPETIHGCLDNQACNFNSSATISDNNCKYQVDCAGECGGVKMIDCSGVCDSNSDYSCCEESSSYSLNCCVIVDYDYEYNCHNDIHSPIYDYQCNNIPCVTCTNGYYTQCGNVIIGYNQDCGYDEIPIESCFEIEFEYNVVLDCSGQINGTDYSCNDCLGVPNGESSEDMCGLCDDDISNDCVQDCAGIWGGNTICGCTNIEANNYNPNATVEDNSCNINLWGMDFNIFTTTSINLSYLNLDYQQGIPSEIGSFTNLIHLSLELNEMSGEIPPEIGNLTNLEYLSLYNNYFTGEIPTEIQNLTSLTYLNLDGNNLSGMIPSGIGNLNSLEELILSRNNFTTLSSNIGNLSNLILLDLYSNSIVTIPIEIGSLNNLKYLYLSNNLLTELPSEICNIYYNLQNSSFYSNYICNELPYCLVGVYDGTGNLISEHQNCP